MTEQCLLLLVLMTFQDRYSFSAIDHWSNSDGQFQLDRFWRYIVRLFDPEEGLGPQWIKDTLDWWKMCASYLFSYPVISHLHFSQTPALKNLPSAGDDDYNSDDDEDNDFAILRRQAVQQRVGGWGQEADDDDDNNFYAAAAPPRLATPVAQPHARAPAVSPHRPPTPHRQSETALPHAQNSEVGLNRSPGCVTPPHIQRSHSRQHYHRSQVALPIIPGPSAIQNHQVTPIAPARFRSSHYNRSHVAVPGPQAVPNHSHGTQALRPHGQIPHGNGIFSLVPARQENGQDRPPIQHHAHVPGPRDGGQHLQAAPSQNEVSNSIQLRVADWTVLGPTTGTSDRTLRDIRQPLRATQPSHRSQVWIMSLPWTSLTCFCSCQTKEHITKPSAAAMRKSMS